MLDQLSRLQSDYPEDWQPTYLKGWAVYQNSPAERRTDSRTHFAESLRLARHAEAPQGIVESLLMLGALAEMVEGDLELGLENYLEAAEAAEATGDDQLFFLSAWSVATVLRQKGSYAEQADWLRRALATLAEDDEGGYRRSGEYALGNAYRKLGDVRAARRHLERTLAMAERADDAFSRSACLMLLGVLESDFGDLGLAIPLFEQARDVARMADMETIENHAEVLIGVARLQLGDAALAREQLQRTLDAAIRYSEGSPEWSTQGVVNLLFLAHADRRLSNETDAENGYLEARAKAKLWRKPNFEWQASAGLASLYLAQGRLEQAIREARRGVEEIESLRSRLPDDSQRVYFLQQRSNVYAVLASALGQKASGLAPAFAVSDRAHARTLQETLSAQSPTGDRLDAPSLQQVQRSLERGELAVHYLLGEDESLLFAVTRNNAALHRLAPRKEIELAVADYLDGLQRPLTSIDARLDPAADFRRYQEHGRRLRNLLLGPVARELQEAHRLIVVPDKRLHHLPFEALPDADDGQTRFLAARLAVSYVPSASFLVGRKRGEFAPVAVLTSSRAYPTLDLPALQHAEGEAEAIHLAWGNDGQATGAASRRALEAALRGNPGTLHIVSHAILHPSQGPQIVLEAPDGSDDHRLLTVQDIASLAPTPQLVVLSACETGEGELVGGEGVLGLVRAFTLAGSTQIVATLWSADDETASKLMGAFHRHLRSGAQPADALSAARKELLADGFVHPFLWSNYVIYGAP